MKKSSYRPTRNYWLSNFYDCAYENIKDEKIPVIVPSYNRYNCSDFLDSVRENMKEDWPIYVVVRKSQKKLYEQNYGDLSSVKFIAFKDEDIDNITKTRIKFINYFSKKFHHIITLDDDINMTIKTKAKSSVDSVKFKEKLIEDKSRNDPARIFAMWQLCHEYLTETYENCFSTSAEINAFVIKLDFAENKSYNISGKSYCAVCLDLEKMKKHKLNYILHDTLIHEDIDLLIRAMNCGLYSIPIKCINFKSRMCNKSVITSQMHFNSSEERIEYQNSVMYNMYKDKNPYISINKDYELLINWRRFRKDIGMNKPCRSIKKEVYDKLQIK